MKYINREISWLSFNARVLQEAENEKVPIVERLRFLGIYANNLDEFYRVRYATVRRAALMEEDQEYHNLIENQTPKELLQQINDTVAHLSLRFEIAYDSILNLLTNEQIYLVNEKNYLPEHQEFMDSFFKSKLAYTFDVLMLDESLEFPELRDDQLYLAVKITKENNHRYALIQVPADKFNRWIELPSINSKKYLIYLEDIIRNYLPYIFSSLDKVTHIEAHSIRITRDAQLSIDNDLRKSFIEKIERSVKSRRKGDPVRMIYDASIANDTLEFLKRSMGLDDYDNFSPGYKYHNRRDLMKFPNIGGKELEYKNILKKKRYIELQPGQTYFDKIAEKDQIIFTPYDDYSTLIRLMRFAAIDPKVHVIKLTIYRVSDHSEMMNALMNASYNGKRVEVCVELQARFDEKHNMELSQKLIDSGINVRYGVRGLKVHAKIGYIERIEKGEKRNYAIISTGNFHEQTAKIYTDYTLLTANKDLTYEVGKVFEFFDQNYNFYDFKHLIVSPKMMRKELETYIDREISNAKKGKKAQINIKANSLCDEKLINKLYEASQKGVEIRLIIRGICSIICEKKGLSENIKGISIVDKYLEHSRVYWFYNNGANDLFISSADLMTRNIDSRVEVSCPIYDKSIKSEIIRTFELFYQDNTKARILNESLDNRFIQNNKKPIRVQFEIANRVQNNDL